MVSGSQQAKPLLVTIIAESRETIDGLHSYLQGAGVSSRCTRALGDVAKVPPSATAVVLFPDEFDEREVLTRLRALRAQRPRALLVLVTSTPQRWSPALERDGRSLSPVVLPKPAFGWSILDAIREHAESP
jgi:hypothetical protein